VGWRNAASWAASGQLRPSSLDDVGWLWEQLFFGLTPLGPEDHDASDHKESEPEGAGWTNKGQTHTQEDRGNQRPHIFPRLGCGWLDSAILDHEAARKDMTPG